MRKELKDDLKRSAVIGFELMIVFYLALLPVELLNSLNKTEQNLTEIYAPWAIPGVSLARYLSGLIAEKWPMLGGFAPYILLLIGIVLNFFIYWLIAYVLMKAYQAIRERME